jgi:hypothetical protein
VTDELTQPPKSLYWIAGIALLWNLIGVMSYVSQVTMSAEMLAALPDAKRLFFENQPAWVTSAYAIAVNAGALGCVLLLLRKSWAIPVFVLSLLGVLVQFGYNYLIADGIAVFGTTSLAVPASITIIGAGLIKYSLDAKAKGWLN